MLPHPNAHISIRLAGTVAIILDLVVIALGALVLAALVGVPYGGVTIAARGLPLYLVISAACVGQLIIAINLLRRRPWARVAFLVSAGGMAFSSLFIIMFVRIVSVWFLRPTPFVPNPVESARDLDLALLLIFAIPIALSVWWLVLFTRPRIIAAFESSSSLPVTAADSTEPGVPRSSAQPSSSGSPVRRYASCPTPVLLVAVWFLISGALGLLSLGRPPARMAPVFFFGAVVNPDTGQLVTTLIRLMLAGLAVGLVRLKGVAIDVILVLQALLVINTLAAIASPNFVHALYEATAPHSPASPETWIPGPSSLRSFMILQVVYSLALFITLVANRNRFLQAVSDSQRLSS